MLPAGTSISGSSKQEQDASLDSAFSWNSDVIVGGSKSGGLSMPVVIAGALALVAIVFLIARR